VPTLRILSAGAAQAVTERIIETFKRETGAEVVADFGVAADARDRMRFFPNGYAAMKWLAASTGAGALGITQVTEILPNTGVTYAGPLPDAFQMKTVYSAGLSVRAAEQKLAGDFLGRYTGASARSLLRDAGYELGE